MKDARVLRALALVTSTRKSWTAARQELAQEKKRCAVESRLARLEEEKRKRREQELAIERIAKKETGGFDF
jgi:hypothetical protein